MDRRTFVAALAAGIAGCSGATPGGTGSPTPTPSPTPRRGDDGTGPTPDDPRDATIERQELVTRQRETGPEYVLTGTATNTGESFLADLAVTATFTRGGEELDSYTMAMIDVGVGETWEVWMPYFGDETPDGGELTVAGFGSIYWSEPDGLAVAGDTLEPATGTDPPRVTGRARNDTGGELGIVEARVKFYAENGNIIAGGTRSTSPLADGGEWPFTVVANSYNFGEWDDRFSSHTATVVTVP